MLAAHAVFVGLCCRQESLVSRSTLVCDAGRILVCVLQDVTAASFVLLQGRVLWPAGQEAA